MKDFFKKLWEAIKSFFCNVWDKFINWILHVSQPRYICLCIGLVLTAFFAIVLPMVAEWPAVPVIALSVVLAFIYMARKTFDWKNFVSVLIGAAIIQLFCFIA